MKVFVNGEEVSIDDPCTVKDLLEKCGMDRGPRAVEVNAQLVPRRNHEEHIVNDGDRVEIVTLVGGG